MEFKLLNKAYGAFRGLSPWARHPSPVLGPLPQPMAAPYSVLQTTGPCVCGGGSGVPGRHWAPPPGGPLHMLYPLLGTVPACAPPFSLAVSPSHFQVWLKPHLLQETPGHCRRIGCRPVHSLHGTVVGPALTSPPFFTLAIKPTLSSLEAGIVRCVSSYLQSLALAGTRREPSKS